MKLKNENFYIFISLIILIYLFNIYYKYKYIVKPINIMMKEINYYYDTYELYSKNNNISIKKINKKLKYKNINIKSCSNYNKQKNIDNLTQCIVDANKKNGIIKNTNEQVSIYDEYYKMKKENKNDNVKILEELYTNVYYLSMYIPIDYNDYRNYYNNTIKIVNTNYKKLNIPKIYYLKGEK